MAAEHPDSGRSGTMANKSLAATARKVLLRRGRTFLRKYQSAGSGQATPMGTDLLSALSDSERRELEDIHGALERIERGIYGRCEICMERIDRSQLELVPWLRVCDPCANLADEDEDAAHEPR